MYKRSDHSQTIGCCRYSESTVAEYKHTLIVNSYT